MFTLLRMSRTHKIYALIDPRDHVVYYIGRTSRPLPDRIDEHLAPHDAWVSKKTQAILDSGARPQIEKRYETTDEKKAFHLELAEIHRLIAEGKSLRNREATQWFFKRYGETFGPSDKKAPPRSTGRKTGKKGAGV